MKNSLQFSEKKTLKLTNVLIRTLGQGEMEQVNRIVINMENDIRVKGVQPVGPLIQYARPLITEDGELDLEMKILRQTSSLVKPAQAIYQALPVLRVADCMYCRYVGPEEQLRLAYDKIAVAAFEEDIKLKGSSYTVFVDQKEEEDYLIADVFMEREK